MLRNKIDHIIDNELIYLQISKSLLKPCFVFNLDDDNKEESLSKFGGSPIPNFNLGNHDLSFLGQIHTKKINLLEKNLPAGILYFFVNANKQSYPISREDYKIVFVEHSSLNFVEPTIDLDGRSINLKESYTVPSYQESILNNFDYDEFHLQDLEEITNEANSVLTNYDYDISHQLLGHPQAIQGTVRFWWAIRYLNFEEKEKYSTEELDQIQAEEHNFILLLQINFSDPKIEIDIFGDAIGYFGIHINDLKTKKFENTIFVTQNT